MCGIAGIVDLHVQRSIDRSLIERMNTSQWHRGPDEGGVHLEPGVGLAHRRLSIIDLSSGQQPLFNEDGSVVVVYNGEIYNFAELRSELQSAGHVFRTMSDTEVIVHGWEEWREACVERFRGMFAFALWDRANRTLFMARDRLGIKPLYYTALSSGQLVFGSELKALLVHPELDRTIAANAVEDYFTFGYVPEPHTIFENVYKLPPGHTLIARRGDRSGPRIQQYWDVRFEVRERRTLSDLTVELSEQLQEAVRVRMVSEVPLGAFLSGGVDSSAVVATMAGLSSSPVRTCSISFGDAAYNESQYAAEVAKRYGTLHRVEQVDPDDFDLLDDLATVYDEPFADSSAIPTFRVCELARQDVTVALSGDGGDESFAGYRRYRWHMLEEAVRGRLPSSIRVPAFTLLGHLYPKADWAPKVLRAKTTLQAIARNSLEAYLHSVSILSDDYRSRLFSAAFKAKLGGYRAIEVFRRHAQSAQVDDPLSMIQYLDFKTYLVGDILTKVDRASMANSLEVRVPILDHKFVEWAAGVGPEHKLKGREGKYLFKKALEPLLPEQVLYRPKMGFAVPIGKWFRGPLRERIGEALLGDVLGDTGIFDGNFLRRIINEHQRGIRDHTAPIWSLLMFESFCRRVLHEGTDSQQAGRASVG